MSTYIGNPLGWPAESRCIMQDAAVFLQAIQDFTNSVGWMIHLHKRAGELQSGTTNQVHKLVDKLSDELDATWVESRERLAALQTAAFVPPHPIGGVDGADWRHRLLVDARKLAELVGGTGERLVRPPLSSDEWAKVTGLCERFAGYEAEVAALCHEAPTADDTKPVSPDSPIVAALQKFKQALEGAAFVLREDIPPRRQVVPEADANRVNRSRRQNFNLLVHRIRAARTELAATGYPMPADWLRINLSVTHRTHHADGMATLELVGLDAAELGRVAADVDGAIDVAAAGTQADSTRQVVKPTTIKVSEDIVKVNGKPFRLRGGNDSKLLRLLLKKRGKAVKADIIERTIGERPARIFERLPKPVQELIQKPGRGQTGYILL